MKKIFSIALACALCLATATACKPETPDEPNRLAPLYSKEDLGNILFTDAKNSLMVNVSENFHLRELLETVKYYEYEQTDLGEVKFVLTLQDLDLEVYSDSVLRFVFADDSEQTATVLNKEFAYLSTILASGEVLFDGYTGEETVEVKNASNAKAENINTTVLIEDLGELRFVKLGNKDHYELGSYAFALKIGADEILVYENHAIKNGELYYLYQGDFEFLNELNFGSSSGGWLPWL